MSTTSMVTIRMYYDAYEYDFGDGFFPYFSPITLVSGKTDISFELTLIDNELVWTQKTEESIQGLDGNIGNELLNKLNAELNVNAKKILNKNGAVLHPKKQKTD